MTWYERHREDLLDRHRGEYVAVVDRDVVDHDTDFDKLARRVFERFGARSIYIPRVMEGAEQVHVRSPRVRTRKVPRGSRSAHGST